AAGLRPRSRRAASASRRARPRARATAAAPTETALSVLLRHVVGRRLHAPAAEQELLALLLEHVVRLLLRQIEPVLVDDSLGVLDPLLPGLRRDRLVDALAQSVVERLVGQPGQGLPQLRALDHPHCERIRPHSGRSDNRTELPQLWPDQFV